jgi:hypothetical protein
MIWCDDGHQVTESRGRRDSSYFAVSFIGFAPVYLSHWLRASVLSIGFAPVSYSLSLTPYGHTMKLADIQMDLAEDPLTMRLTECGTFKFHAELRVFSDPR